MLEESNAALTEQADTQQAKLDELEQKAAIAMSTLSNFRKGSGNYGPDGLGNGVGGSGDVVEMTGDNAALATFDYIISSAQSSLNVFSNFSALIIRAEEQACIPDNVQWMANASLPADMA
jgi:hypothetical protein